jgi:hypothetical protein
MSFMKKHPLRDKLSKGDWIRIQEVIENKIPEHNASPEEIDAAADIFYDAVAGSTQIKLDLATLPTGTYFVRVTAGDKSYTEKLIISK